MADRSDPLAIALWVVGACWGVAVVACLCGSPTEFVIPLTILGICTGIAELAIRRKRR